MGVSRAVVLRAVRRLAGWADTRSPLAAVVVAAGLFDGATAPAAAGTAVLCTAWLTGEKTLGVVAVELLLRKELVLDRLVFVVLPHQTVQIVAVVSFEMVDLVYNMFVVIVENIAVVVGNIAAAAAAAVVVVVVVVVVLKMVELDCNIVDFERMTIVEECWETVDMAVGKIAVEVVGMVFAD